MSDEAKAFMAIGDSLAKHETVKRSSGEYVRDAVHVNSVEGSIRVFAPRSPASFTTSARSMRICISHEIGFRWSQRVVTGNTVRKTRMAAKSCEPFGRACPPALQLPNVFRAATKAVSYTTPWDMIAAGGCHPADNQPKRGDKQCIK